MHVKRAAFAGALGLGMSLCLPLGVLAGYCPVHGAPSQNYNQNNVAEPYMCMTRCGLDSAPTTYFSGWWRSRPSSGASSLGGIRANINVGDPWVQPDSRFLGDTFAMSWVMLDSTIGPNSGEQYAQAGWIQHEGQGGLSYAFGEWNNQGTSNNTCRITMMNSPLAIGSTHLFKTTYKSGPGTGSYNFFYDSNWIADSNDPYCGSGRGVSFTPQHAENYSEAKDRSSEMGGGYNTNQFFNNVNVWYGVAGTLNGAWENYLGAWTILSTDLTWKQGGYELHKWQPSSFSDPTWYGETDDGAANAQVWDDACA
jgi:hypothetical protein